MKLIVDIDGTICQNTHGDYEGATPFLDRIEHLNGLMDSGHEVHYWTARGSVSGKDWTDLTRLQLQQWGVKYSSLRLGKPAYDIWVDDKATHADLFFAKRSPGVHESESPQESAVSPMGAGEPSAHQPPAFNRATSPVVE